MRPARVYGRAHARSIGGFRPFLELAPGPAGLLHCRPAREPDYADRQPHRRPAGRDHRLAARSACPSGTAIRRAAHGGVRRRQAQSLRLRRGGAGLRPHRRGRGHPRPQGQIGQGHRDARRHGRAADRGGNRPAVQVDGAGQDARLRPRRPHRHAARRRALSGRDAQFRRHRGGHLPAGRGGRRRRQGHGRRRADGAFQDRRSLRHAQLSRHAGRAIRHPRRGDDGGDRLCQHRHRRRRRPRGAPASRHRYRAGRRADHQRHPIDRLAQCRSAQVGRGVDLHVPRRQYRKRHSADGAAARHRAQPRRRCAGAAGEAAASGGRGQRRRPTAPRPSSPISATIRCW